MKTDESNPLNVDLTARHTRLTGAIKDYARKKLQSVIQEFPRLIRAHVILDVQKFSQRCEVVVACNHHGRFQVSHVSEDMYASIDLCADKLERQMSKYKSRIQDHRRHYNRHAFCWNKHGLPLPRRCGAVEMFNNRFEMGGLYEAHSNSPDPQKT